MEWRFGEASADGEAADHDGRSIVHIRDIRMASPWCGNARAFSGARDERMNANKSRRRADEVCPSWEEESWRTEPWYSQ